MEYDHLAVYNDGSCQTLIVEGCTNSAASNFNPDANLDNGLCVIPCYESTIIVGGGSWQEEVSWEIMDDDYNLVLAGGVGNFNYCFNNSTMYTLVMYDSYGDGWNGNNFVINSTFYVENFTLSSGSQGSLNFYFP